MLTYADADGLGARGDGSHKGAQAAKTEIEKILTKSGTAGISSRQAVTELANILYTIRDPSKDKPFEIEMCWLCEESNMLHSLVPKQLNLGKSLKFVRKELSWAV
jgi:20S proteasome subunit alpha 7